MTLRMLTVPHAAAAVVGYFKAVIRVLQMSRVSLRGLQQSRNELPADVARMIGKFSIVF